jgi:hypothetical protein
MTSEWDLPSDLVLLCGDGHIWIALDYRGGTPEPQVVFLDVDSHSTPLAATFDVFVSKLVRRPAVQPIGV